MSEDKSGIPVLRLASLKDRVLRLDPCRQYIDRVERWIDLRDEALFHGHRRTAERYAFRLRRELALLDDALGSFTLMMVSVCEVNGIAAEPDLSRYRRFRELVRTLSAEGAGSVGRYVGRRREYGSH